MAEIEEKKLKHLFSKLKELFSEAPVEEAPKIEMTEATLKDGTKVKVSGGIAQGSKITLVNADGSEQPAPNGEHILDDGSILTVTDGIIDSVVPASEPAPDEVGMNEEFAKLKASYVELESKYKTLLENSEKKFKEVDDLKSEFAKSKDVQKATFAVVEQLAGLPAEAPTEAKPQHNFNKNSKLEIIAGAMKEIHSKQN